MKFMAARPAILGLDNRGVPDLLRWDQLSLMLRVPRLTAALLAGSLLLALDEARRIGRRRFGRIRRVLTEPSLQLGDFDLQLGILGLEPIDPGQQRRVCRFDLTIQIFLIRMSSYFLRPVNDHTETSIQWAAERFASSWLTLMPMLHPPILAIMSSTRLRA